MQKILGSMSSEELFSMMDANIAAFWSCYGLAKGCVLHESPALTWFYTGLQFSLFNGVPFINTDEEGVGHTVEALRQRILVYPAQALWWVSPLSRPSNLASLLNKYGLEPVGEVPAMAMNLDDLDDRLDSIPGFTVERVNSPKLQALWGRITAIGNGCNYAVVRNLEQIESSIVADTYQKQMRYIGYLHGKPVASIALVLDGGVAGIYAVATVPEARKKGIGKYLTLKALLDAKERRYRVGILQSSAAGYRIYQSLGFKDVFKYSLYLQS